MRRLTMLMLGLFAATLALTGTHPTTVSAAGLSKLWSIAVHLEYENGSAFDYVFATGVPTEEMPSFLADCGGSHWMGSVVRYYCYPLPE